MVKRLGLVGGRGMEEVGGSGNDKTLIIERSQNFICLKSERKWENLTKVKKCGGGLKEGRVSRGQGHEIGRRSGNDKN